MNILGVSISEPHHDVDGNFKVHAAYGIGCVIVKQNIYTVGLGYAYPKTGSM